MAVEGRGRLTYPLVVQQFQPQVGGGAGGRGFRDGDVGDEGEEGEVRGRPAGEGGGVGWRDNKKITRRGHETI